jgi:hypothetical protein
MQSPAARRLAVADALKLLPPRRSCYSHPIEGKQTLFLSSQML